MTRDVAARLRDRSHAVPWDDVPDEPGWYAVHVDDDGARELTEASGVHLDAGPIYVGEAVRQPCSDIWSGTPTSVT